MNKHWKSAALMLTAAVVAITVASAQRPGPGGPPPSMSPAVRAKMDAWRSWRDKHRNVGAIGRTIRGLIRVESSPATKLSHTQAQNILVILNRWRSKATMTDSQAVTVHHQIMSKLKGAQVSAMASMGRSGFGGPGGPGGPPPPGGRHGGWGGPPGGGPRPGGPPDGRGGFGGGHGFGGFDASKMPSPREYNPLNPSTIPIPPMQSRAQRDLDMLVSMLKRA